VVAAPDPQDQAPTASIIQDVLGWYPADTETITAAVGPFKVVIAEKGTEKKILTLGKELEAASVEPFTEVGDGTLSKLLSGRKVLLGMAGMRNFTDPRGFGVGSYAGCHVLVFQQWDGPARGAVTHSLQAATETTCKIGEDTVFVFKEENEQGIRTTYLMQPQDDVLLCATDLDFLKEMLIRKNKHAKVEAAATRLEGWKELVGTARFWALRSINFGGYGNIECDGAVFTFNPGHAPKIAYFTKAKGAGQAIKKSWTGWSGNAILTPSTHTIRPGVIQATFQFDQKSRGYFLIGLLGLLGHRMAC
jgi:hypothetical protein